MTDFNLSQQELELVTNPELFYIKHRVVTTVYALLGSLSGEYSRLTTLLPNEVLSVSPKIYRGENYRLLPYVMLDQPRLFKPGEAFAIRSLFWWGQHFSIHLVLGGRYKELYQERLKEGICAFPEWYVSCTDDPWQHHFEEGNYKPAGQFNVTDLSADYFKLATFLPLAKWDDAGDFFISSFSRILSLLSR